MKKNILLILTISLVASLIVIPSVMAHCPLCTTGAAVGLGFARAYGVDDSIVGLFIGALVVSSALWFNKWLKKKISFPLQESLLVVISFLLIAVPFYFAGLITNFAMVMSMPEMHGMTGLGVFGLADFGVDKLLFGMIIGTLSLWAIFTLSDSIKKKRGKVLFSYQGMIFMLLTLALLSLIFWSLTK